MPEEHKVGNGIWYTLLFSIISLFFIFQVVTKVPLQESFKQIDWFYIVLGFGVLFLIWLAKAYRMYSIGMGMGLKIKIGFYLKLYLATCFISHVTPFNSGGTPLQIYLLHKKGVMVGKATALTAVDLGLNTAMFFILIPVALLTNIRVFKNGFQLKTSYSLFSWATLIVFFAIIMIMLFKHTGIWSQIKKWSWVLKIRCYLENKGWRKYLRYEWTIFKEGWLLLTRQNPGYIFWAIIATIIYWFFYLLLAPLILWAMETPISFLNTIGLQLLFNFTQIFIPTPGGSGGSELILFYMFKQFTGASRVGTFVLLWKMYTFFSTLMVGGFFFWKLTKKSKENS